MGRPSNRERRRSEIIGAFARVLGEHGYAGATIAMIASEAGIAPGLVHHHFANKQDLIESLLESLIRGFRRRIEAESDGQDRLLAYLEAALALGDRADVSAARCWVGIFAEAIRDPRLFRQIRRLIDTEIDTIRDRSGQELSTDESSAILAFVIGALVLGAFAPRKTAGFAAPSAKKIARGFRVLREQGLVA